MRIKSIDINAFGKLKDVHINTDSGFNVIYGENGAGKSTVMNFIKSVFYGIGKPKERTNLPWDGSKASGSISYRHNGSDALCQVSFGKNAKGDKCEILSSVTGETVGTGHPGTEVFGMNDITFAKTAFISSEGAAVSQKGDDEIAEKLSNLQETGDESISFSAAASDVDGFMARLVAKRGRGGRIQQLEDGIEELKASVSKAEAASLDAYRIKKAIESAAMRKKALSEEIEFLKTASGASEFRYIKGIKAQLDSLPEDENTGSAVRYLEDIKRLSEELSVIEKRIEEIKDTEDAKGRITEEEFASVTELHYSRDKKTGIPLFLLMLAVSVAFACLGFVNPWFFAGVVIFLVLAFLFRPKTSGKGALNEVLEKFGERDYEAFRERYMDQERQDALRNKNKEERERLEAEKTAISEDLSRKRRAAEAEYGSVDGLSGIIDRGEDLKRKRLSLTSALDAALRGRSFEELVRLYGEFQGDIPDDCAERLKNAERQLAENSETMASLEYRGGVLQGGSEDVAELYREIAELSGRRDELRFNYSVLETVLEVLNESYEVMEGEFGEKLNIAAGEILRDITGYSSVRMNRNFEIKLSEKGEIHELSAFSTGLVQQTYLSFRLAMLSLMETPCPVFLDDSLMSCDDGRAEKIMEYLGKLSGSRQVFLFTCRMRDAELGKKNGANIINI